jgi:antitoxin HicB
MREDYVGSDFDEFLKEHGLLAACEAGALKRVVAWQIEQEMKRRKISRAKLANRMKTNRAALDRLFSKNESSVTLQLLEQAALALGRKLKIELA